MSAQQPLGIAAQQRGRGFTPQAQGVEHQRARASGRGGARGRGAGTRAPVVVSSSWRARGELRRRIELALDPPLARRGPRGRPARCPRPDRGRDPPVASMTSRGPGIARGSGDALARRRWRSGSAAADRRSAGRAGACDSRRGTATGVRPARSSSRSLRSTGPAGQNARRGIPANSASSARRIRRREPIHQGPRVVRRGPRRRRPRRRCTARRRPRRRLRGGPAPPRPQRRRRRSASAPRRGPRGSRCRGGRWRSRSSSSARARASWPRRRWTRAIRMSSAPAATGGRHAGSRRCLSRPRSERAGATTASRRRLVAEQLRASRARSAEVTRGNGGERLVEREHALVERLLAADPRREVARLLHPQLEPAGQVRLRLRQLVVGDDLVAQQRELAQDRVERPPDPAGVHAGSHLERAGVGVLDDARRHVVGERVSIDERRGTAGCSSRRRAPR